jgi:GDP-L-fucose synthase
MNILITGSNGFIGRNLSKQLQEKFNYNITNLNRNNCDLLDQESIKNFLDKEQKKYDLVLHTAICGGRRTKDDNNDIVYYNLLMLYNLLTFQDYFQCIVSFGSGAELDRRHDINANSINRYPIDPYGLSKNIIDKLCMAEEKLCNLRIFNCFGIDEKPDRMIRSNIQRYLNKQDIVLYENKKMDFFYIDDLVKLINSFIEHKYFPKSFDCCYAEKYFLYDIAQLINNLDEHKVNIIKETDIEGKEYTGLPAKININYIGLQQAIQTIYSYYKDNITHE